MVKEDLLFFFLIPFISNKNESIEKSTSCFLVWFWFFFRIVYKEPVSKTSTIKSETMQV